MAGNSLRVYVGYLRRKLESGGRPRLIHTVRDVGHVNGRTITASIGPVHEPRASSTTSATNLGQLFELAENGLLGHFALCGRQPSSVASGSS